MNKNNPFFPFDEKWLNLNIEEPVDKDQLFIDPHHHLWDLDFGRYIYEDLLSDIKVSGHNVLASIYIMSSANTKIYDKNCPKEYETIPEIIFAYDQGEKAKSIDSSGTCSFVVSTLGCIYHVYLSFFLKDKSETPYLWTRL